MDNDYFKNTLEAVLYAFHKILNAADENDLIYIKAISKQEIKALNYDLEKLEGEKK